MDDITGRLALVTGGSRSIGVPVTFDTLTEKIWDTTIATNLKSAFLVTQAVLRGMRRRQWGRIINISSTATPDRIPVGRFGQVDEIREAAAMLARNGYVTGQTINVNGRVYMS